MDRLKYIKLENEDGSYSSSIPLAVDSDYVNVNGNTLTNELANKATKTEVQAVASGSPAGVYDTVAALTSADPNHNHIYLVINDGKWYYYNTSTTSWVAGGVYQSSENLDAIMDQNEQMIESLDDILDGDNLTNNIFIEMQYGELKVSGRTIDNPYPSTNNICSTAYIDSGTTVAFDDDVYKLLIVQFNSDVYEDYYGFYNTSPITIPKVGTKKFAIQLRRKDNADISSLINQCYYIETKNNYNLTYNKLNDNKINYEWKEYELPNDFSFNIPIRIFTDKNNFFTNFEKESYKNTGGTIRYVSKNGTSNVTGIIKEQPATFERAYAQSSNGDTIIILDGEYDITSLGWGYVNLQKSLNIIGENNVVIYSGFIDNSFTNHATLDNVIQINKSNILNVIETINKKIFKYELLESATAVNEKKGSYYIDGTTVYINPLVDSDNIALLQRNNDILNMDNELTNLKMYIENITLIGKSDGIIVNKKNTTNTLDVLFNNVNTIYCGNDSNDSFQIYGGNVTFNHCQSIYSFRDGFNYNGVNKSNQSVICNVLEIDSIGANCGLCKSAETMNGSTAHNGAKILRINGLYYDNYGVNVADVQNNTKSVNLGCKAFYSSAPNRNQNFSAQQDGTDMWLVGCVGLGSTYDINCVSNCNMYLDRCCIGQTTGAGNIEIINPVNKDIYLMQEISNLNKKTDYKF